jgi:hypothetical protein
LTKNASEEKKNVDENADKRKGRKEMKTETENEKSRDQEIKRQRQRQKCYLEKKDSASRKNVLTKTQTRGQEGTEMFITWRATWQVART